jgi:hypothetical protein
LSSRREAKAQHSKTYRSISQIGDSYFKNRGIETDNKGFIQLKDKFGMVIRDVAGVKELQITKP